MLAASHSSCLAIFGSLIASSFVAALFVRRPGRMRIIAPPPSLTDRNRADRNRPVTELTPKQAELCRQTEWDFTDLRALFINCTLKRSPERSHTQGLADISMEIMRRQGVTVEAIRAVDHEIASGVWPDMTEHNWERDDWPVLFERIKVADILVLCTPI